jgi:hypothetical protein
MDFRKSLPLTTAVAAALLASACGAEEEDQWTAQTDTAVCTDKEGRRVADENCQRRTAAGVGMGFFAWYYLSRGGAIPAYGERARGGALTPRAGARYARAPVSTGVTRGGFGSSARARAGG